jgi:hypothetical protein
MKLVGDQLESEVHHKQTFQTLVGAGESSAAALRMEVAAGMATCCGHQQIIQVHLSGHPTERMPGFCQSIAQRIVKAPATLSTLLHRRHGGPWCKALQRAGQGAGK